MYIMPSYLYFIYAFKRIIWRPFKILPFTLYYNRFFEMPKIDAKKQQIFFKTYCLCADVIGNSYLAVRDGDRKICFFKV